jgi:hypothetical protein
MTSHAKATSPSGAGFHAARDVAALSSACRRVEGSAADAIVLLGGGDPGVTEGPLPRPSNLDARPIQQEKAQAERGEGSQMLERSLAESVAAIEEDGAEVIILGCSAAFWMRPHLQERLHEMGWEIPVLEGYGSAIEMAKLLLNLRLSVSGLAFPNDHPRKWRRKKTF